MKSRKWMWMTAVYLFTVLAVPLGIAAQDNASQDHKPRHHQYRLIDLGTFGGPQGYFSCCEPVSIVLDNSGTVTGAADTSTSDPNYPNTSLWLPADPFIMHAFQWRNGILTDLGALPGVNSSFGNWISANGLVAGLSENGIIDPLLGIPEAHAVLWRNGRMIDLGTLEGGYESYATGVNSNGQVTGSAVNTIPDPFSPFGLQNRGFLWQDGRMHDLGTLGGPDTAPGPINERGQIAGFSLTSFIPNPTTGIPTLDPFLWKDGKMLDLGTLGGTIGNANALNNQGQVAGQSNLAGDLTFHPFLWSRGVLTDLGTFGGSTGTANWLNDDAAVVGKADLPGSQTHDGFLWRKGVLTDLGTVDGDPCSNALAINSSGQIVGGSGDCSSFSHAFIWENGGPMVDLSTLIPPGSAITLTEAAFINDLGEIAAQGTLSNGDQHAYLLIPCDDKHPGECDDYSMIEVATPQLGAPTTPNLTVKQGNDALASPVDRFRSMMRQRYHLPGQPAAPRD
jgi:probable HAF family extracellular repeat protein